MKRSAILLAGVLAGCSSMQSSRTLAPGKTQVGVSATRIAPNSDVGEPLYLGELRVAHGVSETFEIGGRLDRTPGAGDTYSGIGVYPKWQLSRSETSWVSFAVPLSVAWRDTSLHMIEGGTFEAFPTLFAGTMVGKDVEAVFAPRIAIAKAYSGGDPAYGFGATLGLRFGDPATGSALQPELGVFHATDPGGGEGATFVTIGIGVTAGD